jgi:hypothetical protein
VLDVTNSKFFVSSVFGPVCFPSLPPPLSSKDPPYSIFRPAFHSFTLGHLSPANPMLSPAPLVCSCFHCIKECHDGISRHQCDCSCMRAPSQFLFDAVDDLSKMYLSERWTGSIKFRCLLVHALSTGLFLDKTCTHKVDTCDYLGVSPSHPPYVVHLFLDPEKYGKPSLPGEPISKNPHWMQLKDALELAAHTSGSPIVMCNGGMDYRRFKCKKLCNRV